MRLLPGPCSGHADLEVLDLNVDVGILNPKLKLTGKHSFC